MPLETLPYLLKQDETFRQASWLTETDTDFIALPGLRPALLAAIHSERLKQSLAGTMLVVCATSREADTCRRAFNSLLPAVQTVELPAWETLPHERLSPSRESVGKRLKTFAAIKNTNPESPLVVVASVRAVTQAVSPFSAAAKPRELKVGDSYELTELTDWLLSNGYENVDMVTKRGEFAVRGGILDVFCVTQESAFRLEFFGDELDSARYFAVADQRSLEQIEDFALWPARELLLTDTVRARARELIQQMPHLSEMLVKISEGIVVEGMESLLPQLVPQMYAVTELLPKHSMVAVIAPEKVALRAKNLAETNEEFLQAAWQQAANTAGAADGAAPVTGLQDSSDTGLFTLQQLRSRGCELTWHTVSSFGLDHTQTGSTQRDELAIADPSLQEYFSLAVASLPTAAGTTEAAAHALELVQAEVKAGRSVVICAESAGSVERAAEILADSSLPVHSVATLPHEITAGSVYVVQGFMPEGFAVAGANLVVLSEGEFFGRQISGHNPGERKTVRRSARNVVDPLQLKAGDYVVHDTHGIGRFVELTEKTVSAGSGRHAVKTKREYLVLEYAAAKRGMPNDKLYVPTDQLAQLSRYVGGEAPALNKMGGSDWAAAKKKARKAVRDIAVELVKLYAARAKSVGHAFSADTPWQRELEEAFAYVETVDQLKAIEDVKRDMQQPRPMDRLISGDVGFGKTEIAVRAAFKAVQDSKQVAVLVPTTLLVKQHFETFQSRFAGFPVRLAQLSRFQTDKEAQAVLNGLKTGSIDVVIGTHRLLAKGVEYKDLGLIVIDEEQRFGVEHKDALKQIKNNVDVLSMSATPIPRTLEMAVTGIREMSQLTTAPEDRHPILTFVGQRNDAQTAAAIRREMLREGQVFYVHNRVSSIARVAKRIAEQVPEARVAVAHGRLSQSELEQVVVDFWQRKYDVLVCTTIIETGLDIANANTIIVDGADKYGLSQLHQLRGRVGRGRERAYAYFLYDPDRVLTEQAHERLETIATHNELGSGMQVALKDLELRGAGNLLGGEQSGHIAGVGFDLYLRMIGEAVSTFKGESVHENIELNIELPVEARIPEDYVDSERLRLEAYQKLAAAAHPDAPETHVDLVVDELRDRYGKPPAPVMRLAALSRLRRLAAQHGLLRLYVVNGVLRLEPWQLPDSRQMRLKRLYPGANYREGQVQIPLPAALQGSAVSVGSPFDRGAKAADQALDGDLIAWILRIFAALATD